MWKEFISSIGFGNVVVDTKVKKKQYQVGDTVSGVVEIKGGIVEQDIKGIVLTLLIQYEQDKEDSDFSYHQKEVKEVVLTDIEHVQSNEEISIPFSIHIPIDHWKTKAGVETILRTKLLVEYSVDPTDEDTLIIV